MKLQIISDIHTEMSKDGGMKLINTFQPEGIDVLILAGDILTLTDTLRCRLTIGSIIAKGYKKVLYVPGNHDYWHTNLAEGIKVAKSLEEYFKGNFEFLYTGKIVTVDNQRFLGDTMWFGKIPDLMRRKSMQRGFPDFSLIGNADPELYDEHLKFRSFLEKELKKGDIVITHHMPSHKSVSPRFYGDPGNAFFVTNMEDIILAKEPAVWFHGHTHDFCNYNLYRTRVVCNPQDYPFRAPPVAKHLVIEV